MLPPQVLLRGEDDFQFQIGKFEFHAGIWQKMGLGVRY
jgi:hypothetical protein